MAPKDESLLSAGRLWATDAQGRPIRCEASKCLGPGGMWWDNGGAELRFVRREGLEPGD